MARIKADGFDALIKDLTQIQVADIGKEMLEAAEPIMVERLTQRAATHKYSGAMVASIKSTGTRIRNGDYYLVVWPTGKGPDGVRNMEKMAYLEYGTYKQPATPVVAPAVQDAEPDVLKKMEDAFDQEVRRLKL